MYRTPIRSLKTSAVSTYVTFGLGDGGRRTHATFFHRSVTLFFYRAGSGLGSRRGSRPFLSPDVIQDSDAAAVASANAAASSRKGSLSPDYSGASDEGVV